MAESIAPAWQAGDRHIVHIVFGADLSHRSLEDVETNDAAVRGARLFSLDELEDIVLHPPIMRFVQRWRPGDPAVYLGSLWGALGGRSPSERNDDERNEQHDEQKLRDENSSPDCKE